MANSSVNSGSDVETLRKIPFSTFLEEFKPKFGNPNKNDRREIAFVDANGKLLRRKGYVAVGVTEKKPMFAWFMKEGNNEPLWVVCNETGFDDGFGKKFIDADIED